MRTAHLLGFRLQQEVLEWSGAWWFLATLVVQAVIAPLIGLFVWSAVYPDDPTIGRYYVAVILVTLMTESFEQHTFSERIYDGTLSHELRRLQRASTPAAQRGIKPVLRPLPRPNKDAANGGTQVN